MTNEKASQVFLTSSFFQVVTGDRQPVTGYLLSCSREVVQSCFRFAELRRFAP
jgi:hypothetical protein